MSGERLKKAIESGVGDSWKLAFPSNYLCGADLRGKECQLTIADIEPAHELKGKNNEKKSALVLHFKETKKMMVLNKTNAQSINKAHGPELTKWIGKKITVYPKRGEWFGAVHDALRVKS